ncbi:hypothetical protein BJ322DRAFT_315055 [Thelephora terrestris]|uniref:PUB domain-containing protein n=1 Tax=Thelephora terrestris TaxID=56493 RepID=A0A9P6L360_9AGAM|nr:hypothetical protein BJ322DRAFT_315055 [Thelephora terrestris]
MASCEVSDRLALRNPNAVAILRAAEARNPTASAVSGRTPRVSKNSQFEPWDANHPVRQEFRRLLDPGILGRNNKKDAVVSLRLLNKITENILKYPNDLKYRRLDTNLDKVKLHIMSKNGTVEFLQRMGFRREVKDLQAMLVFNPDRMKDLRTGAKCLEEVIQNQVQAIEDEERARRQEIANRQAAVTKVRNKIYEDRVNVTARVEREKLAREREATQTQADNYEPPVDEMANLKIKTLSDYQTPQEQE